MNTPAEVSIVKAADYNPRLLEAQIEAVLAPLGGLEAFVKPGMRVLVKPNLLSAKGPDRAITTHPEFVAAIARLVRRAGAGVQVGDSPAGAKTGIQRVWDNTGLTEVSRRDDFELVCFESAGVKPVSVNGNQYYIARPVLEADLVISLPKLKTHVLTLMTGGVKNVFGVIPGFRKGLYHKEAPNPRHFAHIIVDIFSAVRPGLTIMDAIDAMEGDGPASGVRRQAGLIMASRDAVALDTVAANIIGLDPAKVHTTRYCQNRGLGMGRMELIAVRGESIDDVRIPDFKLTSNTKMELLPKFLVKVIDPFLWLRPAIAEDLCIQCGECVKSCPTNAMRRIDEDSHPYVVQEHCINCWCCHEICPVRAVEIERSWLAKRLIR